MCVSDSPISGCLEPVRLRRRAFSLGGEGAGACQEQAEAILVNIKA